ncbi:deoxyribodipyrimidine photo-lyase [Lucilia sericata]|uniref:deoxyribodipyrimidine photo-lyase n=1 Tax=Lucilia sericata TaxID=13632 RepID=UPI0018A85085|nr:deoxyribodipyrimidine photo-lyase [Lucilia sericata]
MKIIFTRLFFIRYNYFSKGLYTMKRAAATSSKSSKTADSSKKSKNLNEFVQKTSTSKCKEDVNNFILSLQEKRLRCAASIEDFSFKKKRVRILSKTQEVREDCQGPVVYWMSRDVRVQDNWAFLYAQRLALKLQLPLVVVFCLVPKFLNATIRHYKFMLGGLQEVAEECNDLNITFQLLIGPAKERAPEFVATHDVAAVVCDFAPLRVPLQWVDDVKEKLPDSVPFIQVDAHNVVPVWVASDKQEYGARTIRNKINSKLPEFLTEFPALIKHNIKFKTQLEKVDWKAAFDSLECDMSVDEVENIKPGYKAACQQLLEFCAQRLKKFSEKRNDPTQNALSGLSPWFHFGQISVQRCILEVKEYKTKFKDSVEAFCEEAIVRRELADNFCYYNRNYDNLQGLHAWAAKTLNDHRKDKRSPCYTMEEFEKSRTHDDLWNSAQLQLVNEGKMHGFLRMYWAKKILEWTESPEQALEYAILLNDKYSLDGRDPNGYVGCMWSIGGIHDQGWAERAIFGKIRYMNYQGCKRKFDVNAFVARYGGKVYSKK